MLVGVGQSITTPVSFDFAASLNTGQVGFGNREAHAIFDDLTLDALAGGASAQHPGTELIDILASAAPRPQAARHPVNTVGPIIRQMLARDYAPAAGLAIAWARASESSDFDSILTDHVFNRPR